MYGTIQEPLFEIHDVMERILGYKRMMAQRWFIDDIYNDSELVATCDQIKYLTEDGLYEVLMLSKQQVAKHFRKIVRSILKQLRITQQKQLQDAQKQIEELKKPKLSSIYQFMVNDEVIYIGKDKSIKQDRPQQHMAERLKIINQYSYADIYLATQDVKNIKWIVEQTDENLVDIQEQQYINEIKPLYNQEFNNYNRYICQECMITYQKRAYYEKHMNKYHQ